MKIISLMTTFSGRIGRAQWWLGLAIIMVLAIVTLSFADPDLFNPDAPLPEPTLAEKLIGLVLFWISMAITFKRLQDRDWPAWVAPAVGLFFLPWYVGPFFGVFWDFESMANGTGPLHETVHLWLAVAVAILLLIDNGFLKGTTGPNRYGPDPLPATA